MFCQGLDAHDAGHARKKCPLFKDLKRKTTPYPYIAVELRPRDTAGYAAAGVLLWHCTSDGELKMLLAREVRKRGQVGGDKLNFLGGKRLKESTDPLTCAVDKVYEETAGQLSPATMERMRGGCPLVCWSSESKYVFFLFELVGEEDCDVDNRCSDQVGALRLEWATRKELLDRGWAHREMHRYATGMLRQLTDCHIMDHLEELFDAAPAPSSSKEPPCEQQGISQGDNTESDANVKQVEDLLSRLSVRR
jgi:8-oxo-dGTP pyrophosphatase MutT (NUDIX family)